jgi:hypothetical protein
MVISISPERVTPLKAHAGIRPRRRAGSTRRFPTGCSAGPRRSRCGEDGQGVDLIEDFEPGIDDLVFDGAADADLVSTGRPEPAFIGKSANPVRGQVSYWHEDADTMVFGNADNDTYSEFQVRIGGTD